MKIKNIRKVLAKLLAVTVVFTTVTPTSITWAAPASLQDGLLPQNVNGINLIFRGAGVGDQYNKSMPDVGSDIAIGESSTSGRYLPFYKKDTNTNTVVFDRDLGLKTPGGTTTVEKQKNFLFKQDADDVTPGEQPGYLYGYKISKWMENDYPTPRTEYDTIRVPYRHVDFTATVEKDNTIPMNKVFRITNGLYDEPSGGNVEAFGTHVAATDENIRKLLTPQALKKMYTSGSSTTYEDYVYSLDNNNVNNLSKEFSVGESISNRATVIPGFTTEYADHQYIKYWGINNSTTSGYGEVFENPISDVDKTNVPGSVSYNSSTKQYSIITGNTHAELKHRYKFKANYDVQLIKQDMVYKDVNHDGVADDLTVPIGDTTRTEQSSIKFAQRTTVKPNENYGAIAPRADVPRYVLDKKNPYTITFAHTGDAYVGNGLIEAEVNGIKWVLDQDRNVMKVGTPTTYSDYNDSPITDTIIQDKLKKEIPYFKEEVGADNKLNHNLSFYMPNNNLKVVYNWVKNPSYVSGVKVYYRNNSVNLTKEVVAKLRANSIQVTELGDSNYNNAKVREFSDVAGGEAVGIEYVIQYDSNGNLDTGAYTNNQLIIFAPKLERYHNPHMEQTSGTNFLTTEGYTPNTMIGWMDTSISTQTYRIDLGEDPGKAFFDVNYAPDPSAQVEYLYEVGEGGELKGPNGVIYDRANHPYNTAYSRGVNPHIIFKSDRIPGTPETYSVSLEKDASGKLLSFYDAVPNLGYELKEWLWDKKAENQPNYEPVPSFANGSSLVESGIQNGDPATVGHAVIRVKPVFQKVERMWGNYRFIVDTDKLTYTSAENLQVLLETDGNTSSNDKTWNDIAGQMDFSTNVQIKPGYTGTIKWIDLTDNHVVDGTEIMVGSSTVRTFKAVVESNTPPTAPYQVEADGEMSADGTTSIVINETNNALSSAFRYIVTDESGNIVANITGTQILANGGKIPASLVTGGLIPGYKYKVYSAPVTITSPAGIPDIGQNISGATPGVISTPSSEIIIPTENITATLGLDPNPAHTDRLQITVCPTTEGTQYQLIGPDGSIVNTLVPSTSGVPVIFDNLLQGGVYTVVPISATNPNNSSGNGTPITVDTDTAPIEVPYKLIINTGTTPNLVQVDGANQTIPAPVDGKYIFDGIFKNSQITIVFEQWGLVAPQYYPLTTVDFSRAVTGHTPTAGNTSHTFSMPQGDLIVTPNYMPNGAQVATGSNAVKLDTFDGNTDADASSFPGFLGEPLYSDPSAPYVYRLHVIKTAADANHVAMVQATNTMQSFQGIFSVKAQVEYKRVSDTDWTVYDGDVNPIIMTLATNIIPADLTKTYGMFEIETDAAVVGVDDADFHRPSYINAFTVNGIKNNTDYVFGYFDSKKYPITVKSNRTGITVRSDATDGASYQDTLLAFAEYQRQLANEMNLSSVDTDGVTWEFKGLSKSETSFDTVDLNALITASDILYIYFESDRPQRNNKETELGSLIAQATPLATDNRLSVADQSALQDQINAVLAVLNQVLPRKATTSELQAAIDALRNLYDALARKAGTPIPPVSNGGNSGGGSSSGGGGSSRTNISTGKRTYIEVGVDGNWQLLDEKNHTWVFNLTNGSRVRGWKRLSYTHEGKSRMDWYYFNSDGIMLEGWFYDEQDRNWYYLSEEHNGFFGHLVLGWHKDPQDGKWYYLNPETGAMRTGWNQIVGEWYFLNPTAPTQTYYFSREENKWVYNGSITTRPLGSMYENEQTPDGYLVNASGAWVK